DLTFSPAAASTPAPATPDTGIEPSVEPRTEPRTELRTEPGTEPRTEASPSPRPETDARAGSAHERDTEPLTVAALPEESAPGPVKLPAKNTPLPKPKAAEKPAEQIAALQPSVAHHAKRSAAAKAKPRRQAVAKPDDFQSFFNFPIGK